MAVASPLNKTQAVADGTVGPFTFGFRVDNATDLDVISTNTTTGVDTVKVLTTDYTISGLGVPTGGTITFVATKQPPSGDRLTMIRDVPYTQTLDLQSAGDLPAESVEATFDKVVFQTQQLAEIFARTVVLPLTTTLTNAALPDPTVSANFGKFIRFKADGTGLEAITVNPGQEASLLTTKGDILSFAAAAGRKPIGAANEIPVVDAADGFGWAWKSLVAWFNTLVTTKGDIIVRTATGVVRRAIGADGTVLAADANQTDGVKYVNVAGESFYGVIRNHPDSDVVNTQVRADLSVVTTNDGHLYTPAQGLIFNKTITGAGGMQATAVNSTWNKLYYIRKRIDGVENLFGLRAKDYFKDTSFETATDTARVLRTLTATATDKIAQGFQLATTGKVEFVDAQFDRLGSPVGNFWFTLEADSAGNPSGTPLATSDKYDVARLSTTSLYVRLPFRTPATLSASTQYHLVLQGDYPRSDSVAMQWRGVVAGGYASGSSKDFNGTVWSATPGASGLDRNFKLYVTRNDTALALPAGYDQFVQIGWFYINSIGNIKQFMARDRSIIVGQGPDWRAWTQVLVVDSGDLAAFLPPIPVNVLWTTWNNATGTNIAVGHISATDTVGLTLLEVHQMVQVTITAGWGGVIGRLFMEYQGGMFAANVGAGVRYYPDVITW